LAQWQSALRSVTYANSSNNPSTARRTLSFVANDGSVDSAASTKSVSVAAVNNAPMVVTSGGTASYTEGNAPVAVDVGLSIGDVDSTTLASAAVSITGNFVSGQDLLAFTNDGSTMGNISASYNAATGVLSLSSAGASATLAQWQSALRSVTYANGSSNPSTASRTLSFVVNDGTNGSSASTKAVSVTAVNNAPVVTTTGGTIAYVEAGTPIAVDAGLTVAEARAALSASPTVSPASPPTSRPPKICSPSPTTAAPWATSSPATTPLPACCR